MPDDDTPQPEAASMPGTDDERTLRIDPAEAGAVQHRVGPHRIVRELGRGGQGVVYLADDGELHRPIALKVLSSGTGASAEARLRFRREAEAASRIDHPGICTIHGYGEDRGTPYITMRYVEGTGLDTLIRRTRERGTPRHVQLPGAPGARQGGGEAGRGRPTEVGDVVRLIESVARAVHAAHECGLVHRDIKPGNVMVGNDGTPVVLDFGLARDETREGPELTVSGGVMGTPSYMAPEQVEGRGRLDRRTDVYALGVALFECLTLRRPFVAPTREALYRAIVTGTPAPPSSLNPAVSRDLDTVIAVALERDLGRRYQTAEAFADDLRAVLEHRPIQARPASWSTRVARWSRRHPAAAVLVLVGAVGIPTLVGLVTSIVVRQPLVQAARRQAERERAESWLERGFLLAEGRRTGEAVAAFSRATVGGEILPEALAGIVLAWTDREQWPRGLGALDRHAAVVERFEALRALRAYCLAKSRGAPDVEAVLEPHLAPREPVDAFLLGLRDMTRAESGEVGKWESAMLFFEQAVLRSAPRPVYACRAVFAAGHAGDRDRVDALTRAILEDWGDSAASYYWCGLALSACRDFAAARAVLVRGLERIPGDARLHYAVGAAARMLRDPESAQQSCREALRLDPDYADPHLLLGYLAMDRDDLGAAIAHLRDAIRLAPNEDDAHATLAEALARSGDKEGAREALLAAIRIDPYYAPFRVRLAHLLIELDDRTALLDQARLFAEYNPAVVPALAEEALEGGYPYTAAVALAELERRHPEAFARDDGTLRCASAGAAARAAAGDGRDAADLPATARDAWRRRALETLREELASVRSAADAGTDRGSRLRRRLQRMERHPALDSVRAPSALAALTAEAADPWRALWAEIEVLRARLEG